MAQERAPFESKYSRKLPPQYSRFHAVLRQGSFLCHRRRRRELSSPPAPKFQGLIGVAKAGLHSLFLQVPEGRQGHHGKSGRTYRGAAIRAEIQGAQLERRSGTRNDRGGKTEPARCPVYPPALRHGGPCL